MSDNNNSSDNTDNDKSTNNFIDSLVDEFKNMDYKDVIYLICLIILAGIVIILPKKVKHNGYDVLRIFRTLGVRIIMFIGIIACGLQYDIFITSIIGILSLLLMWISYGIGNNIKTNQIINTSDKFKQLMDILIENNDNDDNNEKSINSSNKQIFNSFINKNINNDNIDINNNDNIKNNNDKDNDNDNNSILNLIPSITSFANKNKIKNLSKKINRLSNIMYSDNEINDNFIDDLQLNEKEPLLKNNKKLFKDKYTNFIQQNNNYNNNQTFNKSTGRRFSPPSSLDFVDDSINSSITINKDLNEIDKLLENNNKFKHLHNKIINSNEEDNKEISLNVSKKISDYNKINKNKFSSLLTNNKKLLNNINKFGIFYSDNDEEDNYYISPPIRTSIKSRFNNNEFFDKFKSLSDEENIDNKNINSPILKNNEWVDDGLNDNNYNNNRNNFRKSDTFLENELKDSFLNLLIDKCNNNDKLKNFIKNNYK